MSLLYGLKKKKTHLLSVLFDNLFTRIFNKDIKKKVTPLQDSSLVNKPTLLKKLHSRQKINK